MSEVAKIKSDMVETERVKNRWRFVFHFCGSLLSKTEHALLQVFYDLD